MISGDARERIHDFRGDFPVTPHDARRIAGLLDAPGCVRRQVVDAASLSTDDLATQLGCRRVERSPSALGRGVRFENIVVSNGMTELIPLARRHLDLEVTAVRQRDLSRQALSLQFPGLSKPQIEELRLRETRQEVASMLGTEPGAINLLRHPLLRLDLGDMPALLEPDLTTHAVGHDLVPVEIKSFAYLDGVADPDKVMDAARQTAVYLIALRQLVAELGHSPERVSTRGLLVMARDFGMRPIAEVISLRPTIVRLQRTLAGFPHARELADRVPTLVHLPAVPPEEASAETKASAAAQTKEAIGALPKRFGDGCVTCPLVDFCRAEARHEDSVAQLGTDTANLCGDVRTITAALELASGNRAPATTAERAVAEELGRAAAALRLAGAAA